MAQVVLEQGREQLHQRSAQELDWELAVDHWLGQVEGKRVRSETQGC